MDLSQNQKFSSFVQKPFVCVFRSLLLSPSSSPFLSPCLHRHHSRELSTTYCVYLWVAVYSPINYHSQVGVQVRLRTDEQVLIPAPNASYRDLGTVMDLG